mmetsp:Transcript_811/g.1298  ORF Transcript_811/g.1298 Transcript_811/m.1298 type:complete len:82 (-) Transcript_811:54-299(-)
MNLSVTLLSGINLQNLCKTCPFYKDSTAHYGTLTLDESKTSAHRSTSCGERVKQTGEGMWWGLQMRLVLVIAEPWCRQGTR